MPPHTYPLYFIRKDQITKPLPFTAFQFGNLVITDEALLAELVLCCEMQGPDEDAIVSLAEEIIGFIFKFGAPKKIRVSNVLVDAGLEQLCDVCKIKLRRVKSLKGITSFKSGMADFI